MPPPLPPFLSGTRGSWGASRAGRIGRRVYHPVGSRYEYEPDPTKRNAAWHEINPRTNEYRDVDEFTGQPLPGYHGTWRPLR